ncbi:TetR/AcrR family transcriptional regulator [Salinisphaera sp.]|uniref:TetR/AcrR family transcriptional regulator n=1 Tax=Salinisphaera sp. TaxID=1914330 RepID=UPI002D78E244|nr:TetR/AcrR family transcriptional regulator [Salinisphaera sp.]HET7314628.1 TetR/AcrR family transcriptional regulator [Salinisphaera sp.]
MSTQSASQPTVERVYDTALSLFARHGYDGMSLSQLASEVGIQKPSLYNHIESKQALFMVLVERVETAFFAALDDSLAGHAQADVHTRLFELVCDLSRFILVEAQGVFYKRYLLFPPEPLASEVRGVTGRGEARIDAALHEIHAQGQRDGVWSELSERGFLDAFYCLMDGLFSERFMYSVDEYDRRVASIWPIFWAGLTARTD